MGKKQGSTIWVGRDGASGGMFMLLPSLSSLREQVEPSLSLHEIQLSRWLGWGGERPGRNGDRLAFGVGILTMTPRGPSPSRELHSNLPQICCQARWIPKKSGSKLSLGRSIRGSCSLRATWSLQLLELRLLTLFISLICQVLSASLNLPSKCSASILPRRLHQFN